MIRCEDYKKTPYACATCNEYITCNISDAFEYGVVKGTEYTINEVINTIDKEFEKGGNSTEYVTKEGKSIHTDTGYVYDWWKVYREMLKERIE